MIGPSLPRARGPGKIDLCPQEFDLGKKKGHRSEPAGGGPHRPMNPGRRRTIEVRQNEDLNQTQAKVTGRPVKHERIWPRRAGGVKEATIKDQPS